MTARLLFFHRGLMRAMNSKSLRQFEFGKLICRFCGQLVLDAAWFVALLAAAVVTKTIPNHIKVVSFVIRKKTWFMLRPLRNSIWLNIEACQFIFKTITGLGLNVSPHSHSSL